MKFLIDDAIVFDVKTNRLILNDEEENSVQLSNQASRLLYQFVTNSECTLTREILITQVWESHGFTGSSVSLNVAVSEIRKALRSLGHDTETIQTLRGTGFCFKAAVQLCDEPSDNGETTRDRAVASRGEAPPSPSGPRSGYKNTALLALVCLTITFVVYVAMSKGGSLLNIQHSSLINSLGNIDNCTIYLVDKNMFRKKDFYMGLVKKEIAVQNIDCKNQKADVYFSFLNKANLKKSFLGICYKTNHSSGYRNCITHHQTNIY